MGEVQVGCIVEIPSGTVFLAERGAGWSTRRRSSCRPTSGSTGCSGPTASAAARARRGRGDRRPDRRVVGRRRHVRAGLGRVRHDAPPDRPARRLRRARPADDRRRPARCSAEFERVGGGAVLNNSPYDLAAAALCLEEGGAIVTDAYGNSLADRPLLGSGAEFQMSIVCSANQALHEAILEQLDAGHRPAESRLPPGSDRRPMTAAIESTRAVSLTVPAKPDYVVLARLALGRRLPARAADPRGGRRPEAGDDRGGGDGRAPRGCRRRRRPADAVPLRRPGRPRRARGLRRRERRRWPQEERDLSAAIIEATVDEYEQDGDAMTLVKLLRRPGE